MCHHFLKTFPKINGPFEYSLGCRDTLNLRFYLGPANTSLDLLQSVNGVGRFPGFVLSCNEVINEISDAEEAYRIGLVEFLVDEGQHLAKALEIAGRMARWSPVALRLVKQSVQAAMETPLSAGLDLERELFLAAFASDDGREGVAAFIEKRKPTFTGT